MRMMDKAKDKAELTTLEKSRFLNRLCGWRRDGDIDLYRPEAMSDAWRVLKWAMNDEAIKGDLIVEWLQMEVYDLPASVAQRKWLDAIYRLAKDKRLDRYF